MQLTVLGATGGTGAQVVEQALAAGHRVLVGLRGPTRPMPDGVDVVQADVLDPSTLAAAIPPGTDAVLFAIGSASGRWPTTVYSQGMVHVLGAMGGVGVRRVVALSATPVTAVSEVGVLERWVLFPLLWQFFGGSYADMGRMEESLAGSGVDWTVLRPPRLMDGPMTGGYRRGLDGHLAGGRSISRADLAHAMLSSVTEGWGLRRCVAVAD